MRYSSSLIFKEPFRTTVIGRSLFLIAEGAVSTLLLWNWDTCVERATPELERFDVAYTQEDMQQLQLPDIAKIHGCATRVATLLITSEQLREPPLWTEAAFKQHLRAATAVFIGIGDVADYAKRRIAELRNDFPHLDLYLVSPEISVRWRESVWVELLPDLEQDRRVDRTADEFLDQLARVWALQPIEAVRVASSDFSEHVRRSWQRVETAFLEMCGADALHWWRTAAMRARTGESIVRAAEAESALVALSVYTRDSEGEVHLTADARCRVGGEVVLELLVSAEARSATTVADEARRRARQLLARGLIEAEATFLVSGHVWGPLTDDEPADVDVLEGRVEPDDVFAGPRGAHCRFVLVSDLLADAA